MQCKIQCNVQYKVQYKVKYKVQYEVQFVIKCTCNVYWWQYIQHLTLHVIHASLIYLLFTFFYFFFFFLDVVIWGNEHECQPRLSESLVGTYRIYQPGTDLSFQNLLSWTLNYLHCLNDNKWWWIILSSQIYYFDSINVSFFKIIEFPLKVIRCEHRLML